MSPPDFDNEFFVITDLHSKELTAICLSYVCKQGFYTPMFEFLSVSCKKEDFDSSEFNENSISYSSTIEFIIKVSNNLKRLSEVQNLLLIGLTEEQYSYIDFLDDYNILEIHNEEDADFLLSPLVEKSEYCHFDKSNVEDSLYKALRSNKILKEGSPEVLESDMAPHQRTMIVTEKVKFSSSLIAVNLANSIQSDFSSIEYNKTTKSEAKNLLQAYGEGGKTSTKELESLIYPIIENVNFIEQDWITFFTVGIPYSLVTKNEVPTSYVNLNLSSDFFVFNSIYSENKKSLLSTVVFSPLEFGLDEETSFVINEFHKREYFVNPLIGKEANVYNIDMHIKHFPFSVLHICSHGGEVDGYKVAESFIDRDGNKHIIEYDEVVSFAPNPVDEKIPVVSKFLWRRFDGYQWKSEELQRKGFEHYVFVDMFNAVKANQKKERKKKQNIPNSTAIKCHDFNYQGMFNHLAGDHFSPFIFNNTCWSWRGISDHFLSVGARGYIGTLWNISNKNARKTAETFYENSRTQTIINALHSSLNHTKETYDENIYIFWGLPFTTIPGTGKSLGASFKEVLYKLSYSIGQWKDHKNKNGKGLDQKTIDEINRIIEWNQNKIRELLRRKLG